jgi:NitT/TauT family transport system substrate-binding protein
MRKLLGAMLAAALLAAPAAARAEAKELRLGIQFGLIYLPITIAAEQGLVEKHAKALGIDGLKVTLNRFSGSTAVIDAVMSGNVDLGAYGLAGLLIAWDKTQGHQEVRGLGAIGITAFVVVTNKPDIKTLKDFTDQNRIALPATNSPQAIILKMAAAQLYGQDHYTHFDTMMVALPHPDAANALLSGQIDGYVSTPPFQQMVLRDQRIHAVARSRDFTGGQDATGVVLGGNKKFGDENPKLAQAAYLGLEDAMAFIQAHPGEAADIYIASEKSKLPKDDVKTMLTDGSTIFDVRPHGLMQFADFMLKVGMLKQAPKDWKDTFFPVAYEKGGD